MTFPIRTLKTPVELAQGAKVFHTAMAGLPRTGFHDAAFVEKLFEPDRVLAAFDAGQIVGTANSYAGSITVPGGEKVSHAAVTHVGVYPTHTRRGVASALLSQQLRDLRAEGVAIATLRASDARIYGRFGYGIASTSVTYALDKRAARLRDGVTGRDAVRLVDPDSAWPLLQRLYASRPDTRAGTISRAQGWWDFQALRQSQGTGTTYVAVHGAAGAEDGYLRYHPLDADNWYFSTERTIFVDDLVAHSPQAYAALVAHLIALDLPHKIIFWARPEDDVLPWLLQDHRAARVSAVHDETWLRLTDVQTALAARSYAGSASAVIEVTDTILPENAGRWRISPAGAEPTNADADLRADAGALASAYLGGARWWQLAQAGRVQVLTPQAIATLDALFATPFAPHSGTMF